MTVAFGEVEEHGPAGGFRPDLLAIVEARVHRE
jgi:hypothetical protein